ncbi:hypothetical protein [Massilia sp. TN1-12]|jgi:hypothetical protein|nr:hypothetical protein [uncultured Massilia sp.]
MDGLVDRVVGALRQKPMRFGYVLAVLLVSVVLFSLADFLPAPYAISR